VPVPGSTDYLLQLWLASAAAGELIGARLRSIGIEPHLFGLLSQIARREPVAPSVIASEEGMPVTTVRDNVQRLVERGLVRRVPNPDDGRSYRLVRTEGGVAVLELANVVMAGVYDELAGALPRQPGEYERLLAELHRGIVAVAAGDGHPRGREAVPGRPTRNGS
jgi:DNA-binding MarR family transcriptional regulator